MIIKMRYWLVQWFKLANAATAFWFAPMTVYYERAQD
jgi:hypothetical protein